MYISAFSSSSIACYDNTDKNGTLYSSATAGLINPQGETATWGPPDQQQLIVANTGAHNILEFKGNCARRLVRTMTSSTFPVGVAVARDGNIYVSTIYDYRFDRRASNYECCIYAQVDKYAPTDNNGVAIGDPNMFQDFFVAVKADDSEICVDGFNNNNATEVDCTTDGGKTWTNTGLILGFPGGITFDNLGNLIVDDQNGAITGGGVTIACPSSSGCINIAFDQGDKHLIVSDINTNMAYQIDWPSGNVDFAVSSNGTSTISAQPIPRN